ncbi:PREDICTED: low affinity sulfate transporter 3-like [Nicotiana attenuata]|uniref:Sulfate transporter 2.1 n=1 Tax=Nicotiana attenuata TaxID=49451 RepID=A0A314LHH6_NICAT|nr:PREDICTED: low affinity sulfate transporter 3-like [Nicotiana attenuata]OIT40044.1 sulfate transporter 2.1 [Nicotiana attenuata]
MAVSREGETESSHLAQTVEGTTLPTLAESQKNTCDQFSQTLQTPMASENERRRNWVLNVPEPPGLFSKLKTSFKKTIFSPLENKLHCIGKQPLPALFSILNTIFPPLSWCKQYNVTKFKSDILAGLTLASLCIPQSIGYATLAKLDPQYGLYTSVIPPLIYSMMGSSRDIAIGPVAVVSLLLSSMIQKFEDPAVNPAAYTKLVLTVTFFAGTFQAAFGLLRLGFLVDFLSHAAIVGFMAGAACVIGLQQLKSLLGLSKFTNNTDIISVLTSISKSMHTWNPFSFMIGSSFLIFILFTKYYLARKHKKLFLLSAMAPLLSVILSTLIVFLTRADKHGVKIVKHITGGLNPTSIHELQFNSPHTAEAAKIGLIVALIALTEAIAVGRSFATMKGYRLDGNKEMLAMGVMNITGSLTSCYVATGSFSRTAVNFSAGCETAVSNIVMAVTVLISLEFFTRLLYFTPIAILASIILSALPGLINLSEAKYIWKVDKMDFLTCTAAFFGVLFVSVEIGLLLAVGISFAKVILNSIQPGTEKLGRLPGSDLFGDVNQYPMAMKIPGALIVRVKSALLCFANANFIRAKILNLAQEEQNEDAIESAEDKVQLVILDMSNLLNIDTSSIAALEELHNELESNGMKLALANPRWHVIHKLRLAKFVKKIEGRVYLTIGEAIEACLTSKSMHASSLNMV